VAFLGAIAEDERVAAPAPIEAAPERGRIEINGGVLTEAVRWVADDGAHVVQSTEFDVAGVGSDWPSATHDFLARAEDLFGHLIAMTEEGRATDADRATARALGQRILDFYQGWTAALERQLDEAMKMSLGGSLLTALSFGRRRAIRQRPETWLPQTQKSSSPRLNA
jgi:hypothetical protein